MIRLSFLLFLLVALFSMVKAGTAAEAAAPADPSILTALGLTLILVGFWRRKREEKE
jgi:hypothetical protein